MHLNSSMSAIRIPRDGPSPVVRGHHGTSQESLPRILDEGFRSSRNEWDWLGDGTYFWQDDFDRALEWARQLHGAGAVVVEVAIDLRDCMDLNSREWFNLLSDFGDEVIADMKASGITLPVQTGKRHTRDRLVINRLVDVLASEGIPIASVRKMFPEGNPAFEGSALLSQSHVQIAVRDQSVVDVISYWKEGEGWTKLLARDVL